MKQMDVILLSDDARFVDNLMNKLPYLHIETKEGANFEYTARWM